MEAALPLTAAGVIGALAALSPLVRSAFKFTAQHNRESLERILRELKTARMMLQRVADRSDRCGSDASHLKLVDIGRDLKR